MKEIINANSIEGKIVRYFMIAVIAFFALKIGDHTSAFFLSVTTMTVASVLGYGLTGIFFGFALWLMFERGAKTLVYFLPLFLILGQWIASYMAFGESGRSDDFSPFRVLGYMLTSELGFHQLVIIPVGAFASVWILAKYRPSPNSPIVDNLQNKQVVPHGTSEG